MIIELMPHINECLKKQFTLNCVTDSENTSVHRAIKGVFASFIFNTEIISENDSVMKETLNSYIEP